MTNRISRANALLLSALVALPALAGCGGSTSDSSAAPASAASTPAATDSSSAADSSPAQSSPDQSSPAQSSAAQVNPAQSLSATLTWPQGTDTFALNVCSSVGEHTIMGGGNTADGKFNLVFDANLLAAGDTGTLAVTQKSDMNVVYDATITSLTVTSDGSFTGAGEDAGKKAFTITGTCDVSW